MFRKLTAALLLTLCLPLTAHAAARGTTAWTCADGEPTGTLTIDSGSNRKFVAYVFQELSSTLTVSTFTVGGQAATEAPAYDETSTTGDHHHKGFIWNEAAIAAMSGSTVSYTDDTADTDKIWCYATIVDTDQAALSGFDDTSVTTAATSLDVTTTSASGDHVVVFMIGEAAARDFTAWDTLTERLDNAFANATNFGIGEGNGGDATTTVTGDATTAQYTGTSLVFLNAGSAPALTSANVVPAADGYTVSGTCTGSGTLTVEAVSCAQGDAAPNATELFAGQCGGGNAALMNNSETWTTAVANDFLLTSANKPYRLDVYVACTNGTPDTVQTFADEDRSPRSGFAFINPTSIASTSIFDLDAYFDTDFTASQDGAEYEDDTNESANCNILFAANGNHVYYDATDGVNTTNLFGGAPAGIDESGDAGNDSIDDCAGKRTSEISYEKGNSATTALFAAPASVGIFTADDLLCNGNTAPVEETEPEDLVILLYKDVLMTTRQMADNFFDADVDSLTFTGSPPTGTTLSGAGAFAGTPTVQDEVGSVFAVTAADNCGDSAVSSSTVYVTDDVIVAPNAVGDTVAEAAVELDAVRPWLLVEDQIIATFAYDAVVLAGDIISQDPAAAANMTAIEPLEVVVSLGVQPEGGRPRGRLGAGAGIP